MTLSVAISTTTALTTATTGAITRAITQPGTLSSVATRIPMPSARIKKGACKLARYLPTYARMESKHADKTTDNDMDLDFELLAEVYSDDEPEIIHVEDEEEEQDEWPEDSWSSDETSDASDEEPLETDWDLTAFDQAPATKDIPDLLAAAVNDPELAHIAGRFPHWSDIEVRGFRRLSDTIRRLLLDLGLADYRPGDSSKSLWWFCHMADIDVRALTAHISEVMAAVAPRWQPTEQERQGQGRRDFVL